jgi:hypothetical protein
VKRVLAQKEAQTESMEEQKVAEVELDLDLDEDEDEPQVQREPERKTKRRSTRASTAAEAMGTEEADLRGSGDNEKTPERTDRRNPERSRRPPNWLAGNENEGAWVTPRAHEKGSAGRTRRG